MVAFARLDKLVAITIKVQRMVGNAEVENVSRHVLDLLDARVTELEHLATILTDEMVVLRILVRLLKIGNVLTELMLGHEFAVEQQFNGVVKRGSADAIILLLHLQVERFDVEMSDTRIDLSEDSEPLRGFPVSVLLQVVGEDTLHVLQNVRSLFGLHALGKDSKLTDPSRVITPNGRTYEDPFVHSIRQL